MARFFKSEHDAANEREKMLRDFSDLLFAELNRWSGENPLNTTIEKLALHLNVKVADVYEWLEGKSFPSGELLVRIYIIIRGGSSQDDVQDITWSKILEFIHEVENVQALKDVKLTYPQKSIK